MNHIRTALAATLVSELALCAAAWIALVVHVRSTRTAKSPMEASVS